MSNPGVIVLASLKKPFPYRFEVEDNIGEAIHIHFQDMRIDLTVKEFLDITDKLQQILDNMVFESDG